MSREHTASRRQFMTTTASAVAAATILPRHVLGGPGFVAPSDKVNVAIIGVGGQGRSNLRSLLQEADCQVIAIADPCEEWDLSPFYYGGKAGRGPIRAEIEEAYRAKTPNYKCAVYEDFRVMLEKEKAIDAVLIATPDHLHAYVSILAMKAGKHVYCEKPLTHDIAEARTVARIAKETGVATQMGNQGRSSEGHRQTAEWIWDGAIGRRPRGARLGRRRGIRQGTRAPGGHPGGAAGPQLGPVAGAPRVPPLSPGLRAVRLARVLGLRGRGAAGPRDPPPRPGVQRAGARHPADRGSHGLRWRGRGGLLGGMLVTWRFGARGDKVPVTVHWYDGGLRPPTPPGIDPDDPKQRLGEGNSGIIFIGEKGIITCAGWSGMPRLLPLELHREYKRPAKTLPRVEGHHADWLQACKGGKPASSNFEYGARLCEFVMLGNVALRAKKLIRWDGPNMKVTNAPEADQYLRSTYRAGWELPV